MVLGSGDNIIATVDPWLRNKEHYKVTQCAFYEGIEKKVSSLFLPGEKQWNEPLIRRNFIQEDAEEILAINIPQSAIPDRMVWANANNGGYTANGAYHFWY